MNRARSALACLALLLAPAACHGPLGVWPGAQYAVSLLLASNPVPRGADLEATIIVTNLTSDTLEFDFCDGGQYELELLTLWNDPVLHAPEAVITMPTSFAVPPYGIHTIPTGFSTRAMAAVAPGAYWLRAHILYDEQPSAQTAVTLLP